jgi:hypothetical protein
VYGESLAEELNLLRIHVNVVCPVVCEVVELMVVLRDGVVPLSQVEELAAHEAHR